MASLTIDENAIARLLEVIGGSTENLHELIEDCENTAPSLLDTMKSASEAADWTALRIAAHSLKSNAREFGAFALGSLCEVLEQQSRDGDVQDPVGQVSTINTELATALRALLAIKVGND